MMVWDEKGAWQQLEPANPVHFYFSWMHIKIHKTAFNKLRHTLFPCKCMHVHTTQQMCLSQCKLYSVCMYRTNHLVFLFPWCYYRPDQTICWVSDIFLSRECTLLCSVFFSMHRSQCKKKIICTIQFDERNEVRAFNIQGRCLP